MFAGQAKQVSDYMSKHVNSIYIISIYFYCKHNPRSMWQGDVN
jgi:hypothetical protein